MLTDQQAAFVEHYLMCWNATEAAKRAGYSAHTAYSQGARLLRNVEIRAGIDARLAELRMSADEVLARLSEQASADMSDFLTARGRGFTLDIKKAQERGKSHLIKKYRKTKQGVEIELYDAQAALVHLGRHYALFSDTINVRDWREVAKAQGVDPDALIEQFKSHILAGKVKVDATGDGTENS